jgi:tetratricopeptide (TPR) repeat protein/cbb3-type cytochrome oxidase subunit 3
MSIGKLSRTFCCFFLGRVIYLTLLLIALTPANSQNKKDSLWKIWKDVSNPDTTRLVAIGHLCSNYYWYSNPDSAVLLADIEYDFAEKQQLKNFMGVALLKKSGAYSFLGEYAVSLFYAQEGLKIFREINHESGIANSLNNIGQDYMSMGNYTEAVHCFYEGLKYFVRTGNMRAQAQAYSNIGQAYQVSGKLDSAIRLNRYALKLCETVNDKRGVAFLLADLGGLYTEISKTKEAFYYCNKAIPLYQELKSKQGEAGCYHNLGKNYLHEEDFKQAKYYSEKALLLSTEVKDERGVAASHLLLSRLNKSLGNTNKAIIQAKEGLAAISYAHIHELTYELTSLLGDLYEQQGDYKQALHMNKLAAAERDSSNTTNLKNALYQEETKYNFEKKEILANAEHKATLNALQVELERKDFRKNAWQIGLLALLIVLLLSAYFIYNTFKQKNIIAEQKNNILKQQLLVSQMSPHFIFNSLNAVQNFIFKQDSYKAGIYLKQFSELIRMILEFSRKDLISLEEELNFLRNYLELQKLRFSSKINYEIKIDPALDHEMVLIPPMLAQPFVENAIEHGIFYKQGDGFLSIKISLKENRMIYEIEDDGIGLEKSVVLRKKLNANHKSLAITITKERIAAMNSDMKSDFEIEINDKAQTNALSSGVYVKFSTPYLTL